MISVSTAQPGPAPRVIDLELAVQIRVVDGAAEVIRSEVKAKLPEHPPFDWVGLPNDCLTCRRREQVCDDHPF
jgi:hypothetical protein